MIQTDCNINPERVSKLLVATAVEHEKVLSDPRPSVFLLKHANSVASFQLNVWLANPPDSQSVQSDVKRLIWEAFDEHEIAHPASEMDLQFPDRAPFDSAVGSSGDAKLD